MLQVETVRLYLDIVKDIDKLEEEIICSSVDQAPAQIEQIRVISDVRVSISKRFGEYVDKFNGANDERGK